MTATWTYVEVWSIRPSEKQSTDIQVFQTNLITQACIHNTWWFDEEWISFKMAKRSEKNELEKPQI